MFNPIKYGGIKVPLWLLCNLHFFKTFILKSTLLNLRLYLFTYWFILSSTNPTGLNELSTTLEGIVAIILRRNTSAGQSPKRRLKIATLI